MRMCSIASGSSGNCIYVGSDDITSSGRYGNQQEKNRRRSEKLGD